MLAETDLEEILAETELLLPDVLIVDSIQTIYKSDLNSAPGNTTQIKECAMTLMQYAKRHNVTIFIVGHVNKEGTLAGPKILEHMVDCVLYFEGEKQVSFRCLRAAKNRFGSTNEIGVFEMSDCGLVRRDAFRSSHRRLRQLHCLYDGGQPADSGGNSGTRDKNSVWHAAPHVCGCRL